MNTDSKRCRIIGSRLAEEWIVRATYRQRGGENITVDHSFWNSWDDAEKFRSILPLCANVVRIEMIKVPINHPDL